MNSSFNGILKGIRDSIAKVTLFAIELSPLKQKACLVAVSKTKPIELIKQVYDEGQRDFGENYVEEISEKWTKLPQDIQWHFIGHLQSNKVSTLMKTIDSMKLADKVNKQCDKLQRQMLKILNSILILSNVLIQVKLSEEVSKAGVLPENTLELVQHIISKCKNLKFRGFMTIGMEGDLNVFKQLFQLRKEIATTLSINEIDLDLSMGMSSDFSEAIVSGASIVRIGSSIFGARI